MAHKSQKDLWEMVEKAQKKIKIGSLYYHYKDPKNLYVIESIGLIESTDEPAVLYRALYGHGILWIRTLSNFTEKVKTPTGYSPRFAKLSK